MQDEKKVTTNTVDPVVDQKIIKNHRPKWLWWMLPLLVLLLLLIWFMKYYNDKPTDPQVTENNPPTVTTDNSSRVSDGNAVDKINAWYAGNKNADSGWIALDSVNFNSGSANPVTDGSGQLQKIADILNSHPDTKAVIRGFADASGPQTLNDNLSAERANAVRDWFVSHNVSAARLSVDGMGASAPVASNATEQGREMNRRVALKILSGK